MAGADAAWTRTEFERGMEAFERVFGFAAAVARRRRLANQRARPRARAGIRFASYASDTRGGRRSFRCSQPASSPCLQIPTTLPTFDELLGRDGIDESNIADALFRLSAASAPEPLQVFTLHAELEGMRLHELSSRCS